MYKLYCNRFNVKIVFKLLNFLCCNTCLKVIFIVITGRSTDKERKRKNKKKQSKKKYNENGELVNHYKNRHSKIRKRKKAEEPKEPEKSEEHEGILNIPLLFFISSCIVILIQRK